jgi:GntR family transcriptional repressor for pyruvate dehydrogenase complex
MPPRPDAAPAIGLRQRLSLAEQVTRDLTARLATGELRPGDQLPTERELVDHYKVSRTVVREAISSLRAAGRLVTRQGRGAFVLEPPPEAPGYRLNPAEIGTAQDMLRVMEVRIAIEAEAAYLAADRRQDGQVAELVALHDAFGAAAGDAEGSAGRDEEFHLRIAHLTGNGYFASLLAGLAPRLLPRARLDLFRADGAARLAYHRRLQLEHGNILDAVARGDAEAARAAMRLHLTNSRERLRAALRQLDPGLA